MEQGSTGRWAWLVGKVALGVTALLVFGATGYAWVYYAEFTEGLTRSQALGSGTPRSTDGATNILIMGLDSRLDQNGNPLPQAVYDQLHAGDSSNGGYNTNVLMVLHVPEDGSRATLVSVPRDDYVALPGSPAGHAKGKIKQGYGLAKYAREQQLAAQGVTDRKTLEAQGREAGRKQTVDSVRAFLGGIPIDHFVEVTLVGFYDLAQALGSITVCLQGPTQDSYSGARFVKGQQQLDAGQALAFVRQRRDYVHPELNFTDLDRERRQQAFLASASHQLKSAGTFADPGKLAGLVQAAKKNIVIDEGLDLMDFVQRSQGLTGGGITFTTLPIKGFGRINGEDVNLVDLALVRATVRELIGDRKPAPTTLPPAIVDVVNAAGIEGVAGQVQNGLVGKGMTKGSTHTHPHQLGESALYYGKGADEAARAVADLLGLSAELDPDTTANHVRVVAGTDFTLPAVLTPTTSAAPTTSRPAAAAAPAPATAPSGPMEAMQGGDVPCVK
ncbi:LCP family protein [Kutzneria albida]|uniref:Transcription regulator n=1 Tax=Kutzneria albida DSM 43870 TaxID=1449976 RepID=W5W7E5_9PSEU|nr:LCP family protein [Kutzneria albida]AHH96476.1 transcription regulator [Kutzneria albida DSM 43870]